MNAIDIATNEPSDYDFFIQFAKARRVLAVNRLDDFDTRLSGVLIDYFPHKTLREIAFLMWRIYQHIDICDIEVK